MAGKTRLFEQVGGLLREVDPAKTDALRAKRPCRRMHLDIDVLLTDDEVAEMKAQAERATEDKRKSAARAEAARQSREEAMKKLEALGITQNDIKLVLGLA